MTSPSTTTASRSSASRLTPRAPQRSAPPVPRCAAPAPRSRAGSPAVPAWKRPSTNGVASLPATPCSSAAGERVDEHAVVQGRVHRLVRRERVGHHDRLPEPQLATGALDGGDLGRVVHAPRHRVPRVGQVEAGHPVGPEAQDRHRQRLEPLQRGAHVQDRLHARAHHHHRGVGQGEQVGRLVERLRRAAVDAPEPAGGERGDARPGGDRGGAGDRRRARHAAHQRGPQVADAELQDVLALRDLPEGRVVETHPHLAVEHRDRRGHRALLAHRRLDLPRDPQVVGAGQPVRQDRRLERHHRAAVRERGGHLVRDPHVPP